MVFRFLPPGRYRLISEALDFPFDAVAGEQVTLEFAPAGYNAAQSTTAEVRTTVSRGGGYGTRFDSTALRLLPQSGSIWGLIERADPLVVTERIEGGGAYPEMQRIGASGASWTQTSYRLGEADITDPDPTGYPLLYPNLDALEAMNVITAGQTPDGYGGGTAVTLVPRRPTAAWQRSFQFLGSPHGFQSVNVLPGAPSIGRLQSNASGSFVVSGPVSPRVGLLVAGALGAVVTAGTGRGGDTAEPHAGSLSTCGVRRHAPGRAPRFRAERSRRTPFCGARQARGSGAAAARSIHGSLEHLGASPGGRARLDGQRHVRERDIGAGAVGRCDHGCNRAAARWCALGSRGIGHQQPGSHVRQLAGRPRADPRVRQCAPAAIRRQRLVHWRLPASARGHDHRRTRGWSSRPRVRIHGCRAPEVERRRGGVLGHGPHTGDVAGRYRRRTSGRLDVRVARRYPAGIPWRAISPSIQGTWRALPNGRLTLVAGYAKDSSRLPLDYLAWGDSNSLSGSVHAWTDRNGDLVPAGRRNRRARGPSRSMLRRRPTEHHRAEPSPAVHE